MARKRIKFNAASYIRSHLWTSITIVIVGAMLYVIGRNVVHAITIKSKIHSLVHEKEAIQELITRDSMVVDGLKTNSQIERYAREQYLMQRENEEVFIIK